MVSHRVLQASIVLATFALALGYGLGELWAPALLVVAVGGLWLLGLWRRLRWMAWVGLFLFAGGAAAGLLQGLGAGWMLFGLVAALTAWDLDDFLHRLESVERVEGQRGLELAHLRRLLVVNGLGLLLASVALGLRLDLGFGAVLLLGGLAILGLSRVVVFLRHESE